MLLELSEVFVCPRCRPAQGMVVMVDRLEGRRVLEGRLGCPGCDVRVPVSRGTIRFDLAASGESEGGEEGGPAVPEGTTGHPSLPALLRDEAPEEAALRLAALLGAEKAEGYLLLGPGLAPLAGGVAARAPDAEVLALADAREADVEEGVARAVGVEPGRLPLFTGRLAGCALSAPSRPALREGARVLREEARLAVLAPGPGTREELAELPVRTTAEDERAIVAVRQPGGFEAPFARFPGGPRPRPETGEGAGNATEDGRA